MSTAAHPPAPATPSRRVHSAVHYAAGYDPSRPAHYPHSRVPEYASLDSNPVPSSPQRFLPAHHPATKPSARVNPSPTPPSPVPAANGKASSVRRRPPHRIMSDLMADFSQFFRGTANHTDSASRPHVHTPATPLPPTTLRKAYDQEPVSAQESLLPSYELEGGREFSDEPNSMPHLASHTKVVTLSSHHRLHAMARLNELPTTEASPVRTPTPRHSADAVASPLVRASRHQYPVPPKQMRHSLDAVAAASRDRQTCHSRPLSPIQPPPQRSSIDNSLQMAAAAALNASMRHVLPGAIPTSPAHSADAIRVPPPRPTLPTDTPSSARSSTDALPAFNRMSADAALPGRPVYVPQSPLHRTQSNPSATAAARGRRPRPRPPPILTTPDSPGFPKGGSDADVLPAPRLAPGPRPIPLITKRDVTRTSLVTDPDESDAADASPARQSPVQVPVRVAPPPANANDVYEKEPIAYNTKQISVWHTGGKGDESRRGSRDDRRRPATPLKLPNNHNHANSTQSRSKQSNVLPRLSVDQNEYKFDEISQGSLIDGDGFIAPRRQDWNGAIPIDVGEVTEDDFRFGPDESFTDGGFIIWNDGRIETPEKVMRKTSDGLAVEGIPTSSNNLIIVRSLNEFQESFVFRDSQTSARRGKTLGRGAAGRVYLAVHKPSRRKIAVKEINFYDKNKREQLRKELVTLISHQSRFLVRSYGAFYDERGRVHVTLEYMDRGSLSDVIQKVGPIPEAVICKIAEHCLRGLCFLHNNHILHRDVKTGNILLSQKLCRAKLSDFGLARDLKEGQENVANCDGETNSVTNTFVGTPAYMSPERLNGRKYTYASDVWALGISLMECALGRCPFDNLKSYFDFVHAAESTPAALVRGVVSNELYDFISLMTDEKAENRPRARDLLEHEWIQEGVHNSHMFRDWLKGLPQIDRDFEDRHAQHATSSRHSGSKTLHKSSKSKDRKHRKS